LKALHVLGCVQIGKLDAQTVGWRLKPSTEPKKPPTNQPPCPSGTMVSTVQPETRGKRTSAPESAANATNGPVRTAKPCAVGADGPLVATS
jgi:hypothetical protein